MKESIGSQLRAARQARGLSLEQVSDETHIKPHYLEALEADAFDRLPSLFQARGFLRVVGGFLGLDSEALLRQLDRQTGTAAVEGAASSSAERRIAPPPALPKEEGLPRPSEGDGNNDHQAENQPQSAALLQDFSHAPSKGKDAQTIYREIGAELRRIRMLLDLSIEEIERQTHLRPHHIQIMEEGRFDRLASPVQGRGLLKIYASFLGLNTDAILLRYADALQAQLIARQGDRPRKRVGTAKPASGKSYSWLWSAEFLTMVLLSIGVLAFVVWGFSGVMRTRASLPFTPTPFSVAEALLAIEEQSLATATQSPPTPTATLPVEALNPTPIAPDQVRLTEALSPTPSGKVQVIVAAQQRAWLRVLVDGKELYNGRITPGGIFEYNGEEKVEIQTGNAAALKVIYNQQDLGILGDVGEVITRVFTPQGILEPTATVTPTATRTLRPSPTPRPTQTPRPTRTSLPTVTSSPNLSP